MFHTKQVLRTSLWLALIAGLLIAVPVALADPGHEGDDHGGFVTDDPSGEEDALAGFDGAGISYVESFLGSQGAANRADRRARNVSLIGALQGDPFNAAVFGDVAGYKNLAFLGRWRGACPGTGVDIIDISRPAAPVKLSDTGDYADTSMEDMEAMRIGTRDVLGIGLQDCGGVAGVGTTGFELYDISDPANPQLLSFFDATTIDPFTGGVHELDLVQSGNQTLALLAVPNAEANSSDAVGANGTGDLLILDISDPTSPTLIGEWGVLGAPELGLNFYLNVRQGGDARTLLHSVRANEDGSLAYLSYWDAGFITLDITDPSNPEFLGYAPASAPGDSYAAGEEGNAHSVDDARGGNLLVAADEDFSPFAFVITSSAFSPGRSAQEAAFTSTRIATLPGGVMTGEVVHVGRGCPPDAALGIPAGDAYLADPTGKIALIERGLCRFDNKIAWAQINGAVGVLVYNSVAGGDGLILMGGDDPVLLGSPAVIGTDVTVPAAFVGRSTGLLLAGGTPPVTISIGLTFNGWGYLRIFDIKDPANPIQIGTYATANTNNAAVANLGTWSVHNPEVRGNTIYASWYSDGVQIIDISQPSKPRSIGFWTGAGAPANAPAVNIWSVVPHGDLLLVSDRNFGLYILKLTP